jgi:hypothetical protein
LLPRIMGFAIVVFALRFLMGGVIRNLLPREAISEYWFLPYLHMGATEIIFYGLAGIAIPVLIREGSLFKAWLISAVILLCLHVALFVLTSSFAADDWRGYLVLSAPFFGVVLGLALGVMLGRLIVLASSKKLVKQES